MAEATHLLGLPVKHKPGDIKPQGHNSGLDADKVDGKHASELGGGAVHQALTVKGTTDISISGTSSPWTDMSQMSITITTGNNPVLIVFTCSIVCSGQRVATRLLIDGVVEAGAGMGHAYDRTNHGNVNINILKTLSAEEHTIKIQWKKLGGLTAYNRPATQGDYEHRQLTVIELKS